MKRKLLSLLLTAAMIAAMVPATHAANTTEFDFLNEPVYELPAARTSGLIVEPEDPLPDPEETGFLQEPSGELPAVRPDGFLVEPTAPLKSIPAAGQLMAKVLPEELNPEEGWIAISNAEELADISDSGNYYLTDDIDLTDVEWTPITVSGGILTLDGRGHIISNLTMDHSEDGEYSYTSLFESMGTLVVRNLILSNFDFTVGGGYAGALVSSVGTLTLENCSVEGLKIKRGAASVKYVGGFAGTVRRTAFRAVDCAVTGTIDLTPLADTTCTATCVGGMVGYNEGSCMELTDCLSDVDIQLGEGRAEYAGGLVARQYVYGTDVRTALLRCVSSGEIAGAANCTGGMVGSTSAVQIQATDCLFNGALNGLEYGNQGGILGHNWISGSSGTEVTFTNCRSEGELSGATRSVGGLFGYSDSSNYAQNIVFQNCLSSTDITMSGDSYIQVGGMMGNMSATKNTVVSAVGCLNTGDIQVIAQRKDTAPPCAGGLFGTVKASMSSLLRCENRGNISGVYAGGLVACGTTNLELKDCKNSGNVTGQKVGLDHTYAGGLVGSEVGQITNCLSGGTISGGIMGGLAGYYGYGVKVEHCRFTGTLNLSSAETSFNSNDAAKAGGLVGEGTPLMTNCAVSATVITQITAPVEHWVGGLAGSALANGKISSCAVELTVKREDATYCMNAGGLVGCAAGEQFYQNSIANVTVQEKNRNQTTNWYSIDHTDSVGGLVGRMTSTTKALTLLNCGADVDMEFSTVSGMIYTGGLVGLSMAPLTVSQCYAGGSIDVLTQEDKSGGNMGGLVGYAYKTLALGQSYSGVTLSAQHGADKKHSMNMGGLVGYVEQTATMYSCWSDAVIRSKLGKTGVASGVSYMAQYLGGLVGYGDEAMTIQDCCFVGSIWDVYADYAGGIVAQCQDESQIKNCYVRTTLDAPAISTASCGSVGGIVGYASGTQISDCTFSGRIYTQNRSGAGGIAGMVSGSVDNCHTKGGIWGKTAGGIAGSCGADLSNCTSSCSVAPCAGNCVSDYGCGHSLGGIVGTLGGSSVFNCHAEASQSVAKYFDTYRSSTYVYVGGIVGYGETSAVVSGCTARGTSASITNAAGVYVGGIMGFGNYENQLQRCQVNGDVSGTSDGKNLCVGGLLGVGSQTGIKGCTVRGDVRSWLYNTRFGTAYVGGFAGRESLICDSSYHLGKVRYNDPYNTKHTYSLLGYGTLELSNMPDVTLSGREDEYYTVKVLSWDRNNPGVMMPLSGATVTVDGTSMGTTEADGTLSFDSEKAAVNGLATVGAGAEEHFSEDVYTYLADGGSITLALEKKIPGEIYLKSAYLFLDNSVTEVLSGYNTAWVPQKEENPCGVRPTVDWNDIDEDGRTVRLVNGDASAFVSLSDGEVSSVMLQEIFDLEDSIYLEAKGTFNGAPVSAKQLTTIKIKPLDFSLPSDKGSAKAGPDEGEEVETKEDGSSPFLYFLNGVGLNFDLEDLEGYAGSVVYKNGVLTLEFGVEDEEADKNRMSAWKNHKETIALTGKLQIPIQVENGEWAGSLKASINNTTETEHSESVAEKWNSNGWNKKKMTATHNLFIAGVPCFIETTFGFGGSAEIGVHGTLEDPLVNASLLGNVNGGFFGGAGGAANKEVELKLGAYGDIAGEVGVHLDKVLGELEAAPKLTLVVDGDLGARATAKAFIVDLKFELQLGQFKYELGKGAQWTWGWEANNASLGNVMLLDGNGWQPVGRAYLSNGGGFLACDIAPLAFQTDSAAKVRYENISQLAETALSVDSDGSVVLYFTADDGAGGTSGSQGDHMALYRTVQNEGGSWSKPVSISTAGSYPAAPTADGDFVAWVESDKTDTLDEMLSSTAIKVRDPSGTVTTFDLDGYVFHPQLSANGDTAVLTWLSDPTVSAEDLYGGQPTVYTAQYAEGAWSSPTDYSSYNAVDAQPNSTDNVVYVLQEDGTLYCTDSYSELASGAVRFAASDKYVAWFNEAGQLSIANESFYDNVVLDTGYPGSGELVSVTDGTNYVLAWAEEEGIFYTQCSDIDANSWSQPNLLQATVGIPDAFEVALMDGTPVVAYLLTETEENGVSRTDLYTAVPRAEGVDLAVQSLCYDERGVRATGLLTLDGKLFNNGRRALDGYCITVTDEAGKSVYSSGTVESAVASGAFEDIFVSFYPDGLGAHTYTVNVQPLLGNGTELTAAEDGNETNNSLSIALDYADAKIADAAFLAVGETVQLQALAQNVGAVPLDDLTMEVSIGGNVVASQCYTEDGATIPVGSLRQLLLEDPQPNTYYQVTLYSGEQVLDSTMLMYEDPDAEILSAQVMEVAGDQAKITLTGQNMEETAARLFLALYTDDGKMEAGGFGSVTDINGMQSLTIPLSGAPKAGIYDYKLFLLSSDGGFSPLFKPLEGTITVP